METARKDLPIRSKGSTPAIGGPRKGRRGQPPREQRSAPRNCSDGVVHAGLADTPINKIRKGCWVVGLAIVNSDKENWEEAASQPKDGAGS